MKIAVLGATGQTGQFLVNQALQQGHTVTAVVRNPAKLTIHHDNLKVKSLCLFTAQGLAKGRVLRFSAAVTFYDCMILSGSHKVLVAALVLLSN